MEPEVSILPLQEPAICPYPEPDQLNPPPSNLVFRDQFNIIFPFTSTSSRRSLSLRLLQQNPVCASFLPHKCHSPIQPQSSEENAKNKE